MTTAELEELLRELLTTQPLAVLATRDHEQPYCSLVAFAATPDCKRILFATSRQTRKFANLTRCRQVAVLIDNRSGKEADFHEAMAATAVGQADEVLPHELPQARGLYVSKHPHLVEFVTSPTCALIAVAVRTYYVVTQFQHVVEYHVKP